MLPLLLALSGTALAELPEVALVGLHVGGADEARTEEATTVLLSSLEETGMVTAVAPDELARRIDGRETLILGDAFLGQARALMEEGRVLYERAEPAEAIPILEEAVRAFQGAMAFTTDNRELFEALLFLAFAHIVTGDEEAAREAFAHTVLLDPARELDLVNYAPRIVNFHSQVREEVLAAGLGAVQVDAVAPGATIYLDGRHAGTTPKALESLVAGKHYLLIVGPDGGRTAGSLTIKAGKLAQVTAKLEDRGFSGAAEIASDQSVQVQQLYQSLGTHAQTDAILLGGITPEGELGLQLYATHTGAFSKALSTEPGDDPYLSATDLLPVLATYLNSAGDLKASRVSHQVLPLDIGANALLAELLLNPDPKWEVSEPRAPVRWYVWAGAGALVAGGAVGLTVALTREGNGEPEDMDQGTILVSIP